MPALHNIPRLRCYIHAALSYYYPQAELAACFRPCIEPAATAGESDYDGVLILAIGAVGHA